ncbi:MAG TPA: chloride channel protein [Candidatus Baltobacteraceae bacterium]|nr:chloride channel protein [Candidatus Baltobacteraceae bacterium]
MIEYITKDGRTVLRIGRYTFSQTTFLMVTAVIIGIGGGFGAVGFRALITLETYLAFNIIGAGLGKVIGVMAIVVQLAIGGIIAAWITARFAPEAKGHGVPEVMEAVAMRGGKMRPRVIAIKAIASASSIGFGGSCGREGPIVQIGSTIGSVLGQLVRAPAPIVRTLVSCGAAAGISATFNAPIGGVFFAAEIILGEFAPRSFAAIVVSSVLAAVIGRAFLGNHPSFSAAGFVLISPYELILYAILGVICAVWATGFVRMLYFIEDRFEEFKIPAWVKGGIGFALVGVIGIWLPQVFGVGYVSIQQVLDQHVGPGRALLLAIAKPLATSLTLGSGGSGGVFAPSLFTGAFLGDAFGRLVHFMFPVWTAPGAAYGLVGMAALFAAAAEAPMTAILIVFEMSNDYTIILPLMVCVVIATVIGRRLLGSTVYEMKLIRRGVDWQRVRRPRFLSRVKIATIRREPPVVAQLNDEISGIVERDGESGELAVPVCSGRRFIGIVTSADLAKAVAQGHGSDRISSIVQTVNHVLHPDDTVERAATLMADAPIPLLPVVDPRDEHLIGIVTRRDVLQAYRSLVDV